MVARPDSVSASEPPEAVAASWRTFDRGRQFFDAVRSLSRRWRKCYKMNPRFDLATIEGCSLAGIGMYEYYSVGTLLSKKFCPFRVNVGLNFSDFGSKPTLL